MNEFTTELLRKQFGIDSDIVEMVSKAELQLADEFKAQDDIMEYNQYKVLKAFQDSRISDVHFGKTDEELLDCYGKRALESLFVDEQQLMLCEGEYAIPGESGRGRIALYPDAVCVLPQTRRAVRIPLCFTSDIRLDGYRLDFTMRAGETYTVAKMGYDTKPFAERAMQQADRVKKKRAAAAQKLPVNAPFTEKGLFRTERPDQYWNAAFGPGVCAVELYAGEDAATYLYRFREPRAMFALQLEIAMEAMGVHREVIYLTDAQLAEKPLYRMSVDRTPAVRFLRARSDGRLIHSAGHAQRLEEYLKNG